MWLKIFDHMLNTTPRDRLKANVNVEIKSKKGYYSIPMHYPLKMEVIVPLRCPPSHHVPPTHEKTLSLHAWPPWSPRPGYVVKRTTPGRTWTWHFQPRLALHSPGSQLGSTASSAYEHQGHDPHIPTNTALGTSRQPQAHPACQGSPDECKCLAVEVISTPLRHPELATVHNE